ncbi:MAG: hypothetical protein ACTSPR_07355, partial [Candidatus Thorarchaeota archaeon]
MTNSAMMPSTEITRIHMISIIPAGISAGPVILTVYWPERTAVVSDDVIVMRYVKAPVSAGTV